MNYSSLLKSLNKNISQVAHDISHSQFLKDIKPEKGQILKETQARLEQNQGALRGIDSVTTALTSIMRTELGNPNYGYTIKSSLRSEKDINKVVEAQLQVLKNRKIDSEILNDKTINQVKRKMHQNYQEGLRLAQANPMSGYQLYNKMDTVDKAGQLMQTYFTNSDNQIRQNRYLGTIGGYGAATLGYRILSGGTLSRDRYGRSDIAGVPFV